MLNEMVKKINVRSFLGADFKYMGTGFRDGVPHRSYYQNQNCWACVYASEKYDTVIIDIDDPYIGKEYVIDAEILKKIKHPIKNLRIPSSKRGWYSKSADCIFI